MDAVRTLAQATGAWLQYEFACGRSEVFNERYLSVPICQALRHLYPHQIYAEFVHPVLAPFKEGMRGRRPEVDFAVVDPYPKVRCAVESKWIGKDGLSAAAVLWDLMRLELIAHHEAAEAFFIIGGRRKHLDSFFESKAFLGLGSPEKGYKRLLKIDSRRNPRIRLDSPQPDRETVIHKLVVDYQDLSFASRITTSSPSRYPDICPAFQYQVYAWRIVAPPGTHRFKPSNHSVYSQL